MKKCYQLLSILIIVGFVFCLNSCSGGGDGGNNGGEDTNPFSNVGASWTEEKDAAIIVDDSQNVMVVQENVVVWLSSNDEELAVSVGANGLPLLAMTNGNIIYYRNWTSNTVDIAIVSSEGIYTIYRNLDVDPELISDLYKNTSRSAQSLVKFSNEVQLSSALKEGSQIINAVGCGIAVGSAIASSGITIPVVVMACGSTILRVASELAEEDNELLEETSASLTAFSSITCGDPVSCAVSWAALAAEVMEDAEDTVEDNLPLLIEADGKLSDNSDSSPPTTPTGLDADAIYPGRIDLFWNASYDNIGIVGYRVYRDGKYLWSQSGTTTIDSGLNPNTEYCYQVSAIDMAANGSDRSGEVCVTTLDEEPDLTTIIIQPGAEGKDAYVKYILWPSGEESYNGYGNDPLIKFKCSFAANNGIEEEGLLQFSLAQIPSGANIDSARIRLYGYAIINSSAIPEVCLSKLTSTWNESIVKWDTKPANALISCTDFIHEGSRAWYEWDVTSVVQGWINGNPNYGFGLSITGNDTSGEIHSSDNPDSSKRPRLEIVYY